MGKPDVRVISRVNGVYTIRGTIELPGPQALVFDILADYGGLSRVFRDVSHSSLVVSPTGQKFLSQTCTWRFLVFSGQIDSVFQVCDDEQAHHIEFKLDHSNFLRQFNGQWHVLAETPKGSSGSIDTADESCIVDHVMCVKPLFDLPGPIGRVANRIFVAQISRVLEDLAAEVKARTSVEKKPKSTTPECN